MAQEQQAPSHAALSEHERNSPYVAGSGAVNELGQPTSGGTTNTGDSHGVGMNHGSSQAPPVGTGLHSGGKDAGGYYDTPHPGVQHPLQATQDVNIGHEPSAGAPGYGEPDPTHQREGNPGIVGKMKDAVTGQKPGQGTATGHATAGSALPGEEDYRGHAAATPGTGRGTQGIGDKIKGLMSGNKHAQAAPGAGEDGWPRPVPPPGMSNPQLSGAPGGVPGAGHYSPKMDQHGVPGAEHYSPKMDQHGVPGAEHYSPKMDQHGVPSAEHYPPQHGVPGAEHYPDQHAGPTSDAARYDTTPSAPYAKHDTLGGHLNLSSTPHAGHDDKPHLGGAGTPGAVPDAGSNLSSTPAEPHARHDTPTAHNTAGAEYTDSHGNVHQEGPRDDNVKKEGLMSKMLDKLHLSGNKKHNKKAADGVDTATSPTY